MFSSLSRRAIVNDLPLGSGLGKSKLMLYRLILVRCSAGRVPTQRTWFMPRYNMVEKWSMKVSRTLEQCAAS